MIEKTIREFSLEAEQFVIGAVVNDDFVKISTPHGNAVLISEAEWGMLVDAFKLALSAQKQ